MPTTPHNTGLHFTKQQIIDQLKNALEEINECVDIAEIIIAGVQIDIDFKEKTVIINKHTQ